MTKIIMAVLTVAAFVYALWLVLGKRALPDPRQTTGWRRRFRLATLLFVGLLLGHNAACWTCYIPPPTREQQEQRNRREEARAAVSAAWRTLDAGRNEEFRQKLEAAVGENVIQKNTVDMLMVAYDELAMHKQITRSVQPQATCYDMSKLGTTLVTSRERAMKQLELLEKARATDTVGLYTLERTREVLARELEMFYKAAHAHPEDGSEAERRLINQYRCGEIVPSDTAKDAARVIVEMELGK